MSKIQFEFNVATDIAFDVANDVLPVWWMEVYPFRVNQSKLLLHAEIKWLKGDFECSQTPLETFCPLAMTLTKLLKVLKISN